MNLKNLFSFSGRIGRAEWWIFSTVTPILMVAAFVMVAKSDVLAINPYERFGTSMVELSGSSDSSGGGEVVANWPLALLAAMLFLFALAITLAANVKRWHDRGKDGTWVLFGYVPVIGGWWSLIEQGFADGTERVNRYGAENSGSVFWYPRHQVLPQPDPTAPRPPSEWL